LRKLSCSHAQIVVCRRVTRQLSSDASFSDGPLDAQHERDSHARYQVTVFYDQLLKEKGNEISLLYVK